MRIEEIRAALDNNIPVEFTAHCQKRMIERGISRADIFSCIYRGEIIEDYPLDINNTSPNSLPSCLILGVRIVDNKAIHLVIGFNGRKILMISACYPDTDHWYEDFKTRRK